MSKNDLLWHLTKANMMQLRFTETQIIVIIEERGKCFW